LHDAEELLTMPGWVARHHVELASILDRLGLGSRLLDALPSTLAKAGVAIACVLAVFLGITAGVSRRPESTLWRNLYAGLLGAFFLHGFTHLFTAFAFGGYTPGVATAPVIVIPVSLWIYRQLLERGALERRRAIVAAAIAFPLFLPGTILALRFAAWAAESLVRC